MEVLIWFKENFFFFFLIIYCLSVIMVGSVNEFLVKKVKKISSGILSGPSVILSPEVLSREETLLFRDRVVNFVFERDSNKSSEFVLESV